MSTVTGVGAPGVVIPHVHPIPQPLSEAAFVVTAKVRALLAVVAIEGVSETLWTADTAEWARAGLRRLSIGIGAENDLMRGRTVKMPGATSLLTAYFPCTWMKDSGCFSGLQRATSTC